MAQDYTHVSRLLASPLASLKVDPSLERAIKTASKTPTTANMLYIVDMVYQHLSALYPPLVSPGASTPAQATRNLAAMEGSRTREPAPQDLFGANSNNAPYSTPAQATRNLAATEGSNTMEPAPPDLFGANSNNAPHENPGLSIEPQEESPDDPSPAAEGGDLIIAKGNNVPDKPKIKKSKKHKGPYGHGSEYAPEDVPLQALQAQMLHSNRPLYYLLPPP